MTVLTFDVETSARDAGACEIVEAAWLELAAGETLFGPCLDEIDPQLRVKHVHHERFRPQRGITFGSMAVHHILPAEVESCPPSSTFRLPEECAYIIGHSIDYDWEAAGKPAHVKRIDTCAMARHIWPDADGYSQVALIYMLLGPTEETRAAVRGAHSASADVVLNRILLTHILQAKPEITTWSALWEFSEEARIPLTCPMRRYEGTPLEELDRSFVFWCLDQPWFEADYPYFKKGLLRVLENDRKEQLAAARAATATTNEGETEDDDHPF